MGRTRASAKAAGTAFESQVAAYLREHIDDRIERRTKNGNKDRGDIGGLRHMGQRVVIECKNTARINLAGWAAEAEIERGNDDAGVAMIAHKRTGKGRPEDQWITMTLGELVALLSGHRDHLNEEPRMRGATREELEAVAATYRANLGWNPTEAVQRIYGYTPRTASRRVQQARDAGLLPDTTQGRKLA